MFFKRNSQPFLFKLSMLSKGPVLKLSSACSYVQPVLPTALY
uniref:Uncharacterized protein n=1 Tax=Anguilla anguilla TaxID=7936 RepID=A0A0E9X0V1_ANGAN